MNLSEKFSPRTKIQGKIEKQRETTSYEQFHQVNYYGKDTYQSNCQRMESRGRLSFNSMIKHKFWKIKQFAYANSKIIVNKKYKN